MTYTHGLPFRIRWGMWQTSLAAAAGLLSLVVLAVAQIAGPAQGSTPTTGHAANTVSGHVGPALTKIAADSPAKRVEVIVQFQPGTDAATARRAVQSAGGRVTGELHVIHGFAARMSAGAAERLAAESGVRAVTLNAPVKPKALDASGLATSYNQSIRSSETWSEATGKGVGVAVIDTGIAGTHPDFRASATSSKSRVVASAVVNPYARTAEDQYGHGTHVAGIIAGNGSNRSSSDSLRGKYVGVAPEANLISVKVSDDAGDATILDAIYGLQFAVDHKDAYNIRVVNLSLESTVAESYKTDPLDAAAEAAWFSGIVVVAAAGNRGSDADAVDYAPGNDPYVISVGAVDDLGTKSVSDDLLADWSSRGETQDGFAKPDVVAPGAHIVSTLAPKSAITELCKSCVVSSQYFRMGGTSMSAPMVAGAAAQLLELHPELTPDEVKGILMKTGRPISTQNGSSTGKEIQVVNAFTRTNGNPPVANGGLTPNDVVDPTTGEIDYTRSRWSRSRWSSASGSLDPSWDQASYTCDCSVTSDGNIDPTRSRWSRSRWSRSRWSMSFTK